MTALTGPRGPERKGAGQNGAGRGRLRAVLFMVASAACWGLATVMSKGALDHAPPMTLLAVQLAASVAFLGVMILVTGQRVGLDRGATRAALSGALEPGLAYALGMAGLTMTSAASASMIGSTEPIIVVALAFLLFRVRTGLGQLAAIAVAMAGIALTSFSDSRDGGQAGLIGDGLIVLGTVFAALYVVVSSRLVTAIAPLPLAFLQQAVGLLLALLLLGLALILGLERIGRLPGAEGWALMIGSGVVQYALAFWFYLLALRRLPVASAALFLALIPVSGIGGAAVFLGETITALQALGCALIIGAILSTAWSGAGPGARSGH